QTAARNTPLHERRSPIPRGARAIALIGMLLVGAALPAAALAVKAPTKSTTTTTPGATTPTTTTPSTKITIRWRAPVRVEKSNWGGLNSVSCPATNLCVAVDQSGQVSWSTAPTTKRHWHLTKVDFDNSLTGISCTTTTFCAAVDDAGRLIWST